MPLQMLLFGFTITEGVFVGVISGKRMLVSVLAAVLMIEILVRCPTLYAVTTKTDVTGLGGYLLAAAAVLMSACQENTRIFPMDFMLLFGFTITEGVLVGVICSNYTLVSVLVAVLVIGILVPCLALYAGTTKTDITGMGGYLLAAAVVLMIFGISCIP